MKKGTVLLVVCCLSVFNIHTCFAVVRVALPRFAEILSLDYSCCVDSVFSTEFCFIIFSSR
jgi:hypothetical protein